MLTPAEVEALALSLMQQHGLLPGWRFQFDRAKVRLGVCRHRSRVIGLSRHFIASEAGTREEITDTLLHEIAHALVGPNHGHGAVWKQKASEIGARPKRCGPPVKIPHRFVLVCPSCNHQWPRHRRCRVTARYLCPRATCPHKPRLLWREVA